ncbi:MAG: TMEM165/GDT1 family protein [Endomicrobia bacterium]|nr:TMEM165/GDT1 family protein [Bacillota bacterium]MCL1971917.1 TMEM165/GDT1 family protein [Endomicrobiia bacterium]
MESLIASFLLIFVAEMGDKTQLVAMAFTARFKASQVILAISAATILNNLIAVTAGSFLSGAFSLSVIKIIAYILFILFGFWTIYGGKDDGENSGKKIIINPFFTVAIFFFISEFGDKTQIAAMTLTMNYAAPVYVLIGASAGMICANLIGIGAGVILGKKVPAETIKFISAAIFILFGLAGFWNVFVNKFGFKNALISESALIVTVALIIFVIIKINKKRS